MQERFVVTFQLMKLHKLWSLVVVGSNGDVSFAGDEQSTSKEISEMQAVYQSVLADNIDVSDSNALNCASLVKLCFFYFHPVTADCTDRICKYVDTSCFRYGANNLLHF